jgi:hypothetical protein
VYPDDLVRYHKVWDKQLLKAMKNLTRVEQPLQSLLTQDLWEKSVRIAEGREEMDSILTCYYNPEEEEKKQHDYRSTNIMLPVDHSDTQINNRNRQHNN